VPTISKVQSSWTRGMQSTVVSARNDTDILDKGASILDNVVIMQQGGLRKRPCNVFSSSMQSGHILIGVIKAGGFLWGVGTDHTNVSFSKIGVNQTFVINIQVLSSTPSIGITRFIQDRDTVLFTPLWVNVTWNGATWVGSAFVFNSYPISPRLITSQYFSLYSPLSIVYIFYRGDGSNTSKIQSQLPNNVLYTGNVVGMYIPITSLLATTVLIGTIFIINGIFIKTTILPVVNATGGGGSFNYSYTEGIIMSGSAVPATSYIKTDVYVREDTGTFNKWTSYCNTSTISEILIQDNTFYGVNLPAICSNYQNRLVTAVSNTVINASIYLSRNYNNTTIWCSASGNKFSFIQTQAEDDSPFSVVITGDITPTILNIVAGDYLYVFTDNGAYAFVNQQNSTFTTSNINLKKVGNHRCNNVKPVFHNGQIFYVQENGRAILSLSTAQGGDILDIDRTIICPTFISGITHLCSSNNIANIVPNKVGDNSSYLFALGDYVDQGTGLASGKCILAYQFLSSQALDGWTRWTFNGTKYPTSIQTAENRLFASFSDGNIYEFNFGVFTDASSTITLPPAISIKSNPFSMRDQVNGDLLFRSKKFSKIFLYYLDTLLFKVNGITYNVGALFDGDTLAPASGIEEIRQTDNYTLSGNFNTNNVLKQVLIEHQHNTDFQMLALSVQLEIGK
jgi:hypothetical protein